MAPNPRVFMEISIHDKPLGRVVFELFVSSAPRTVENFRLLCTGAAGKSTVSGAPLTYANSIFHRVIPSFMIQGGDHTLGNGKGGESIYGGMFDDEDLITPVDKEGLLVMANKGPNTNGSQFFITLAAAPHLNGKHVVFGRVVSGFEHIQAIESIPTDAKDRPLEPVRISRCGELELQQRAKPAPHDSRSRSASPPPRRGGRRDSVSSFSSASSTSSAPRRKRKSKRRSSISSSSSSFSDSDSDSEDDRRQRRKSKSKKDKKRSKKDKKSSKKDKKSHRDGGDGPAGRGEREETDAEIDARLEREDREKEAERKKVELEELRRRLKREEEEKAEREARGDTGGVRYKGRGAMRFTENSSRVPDLPSYVQRTHAHRQAPPHQRSGPRLGDTWQHDMARGSIDKDFVRGSGNGGGRAPSYPSRRRDDEDRERDRHHQPRERSRSRSPRRREGFGHRAREDSRERERSAPRGDEGEGSRKQELRRPDEPATTESAQGIKELLGEGSDMELEDGE